MLSHTLSVCHRCDRRQPECAGACACTVNGKDIIENAESGICPEGRFKQDGKLATITKGASGLLSAIIDPADAATIEQRQSACAVCPHSRMFAGILNSCAVCGCAIRAKIRVKDEVCPMGQW